MKLLLDENLSAKLKQDLKAHEVSTVEEKGWRSIKNGDLLRLMIASGFEVLITCDSKLPFQQNFRRYPIPVIVLKGKRLDDSIILEFAPGINKLLKGRLKPGPHELTLD